MKTPVEAKIVGLSISNGGVPKTPVQTANVGPLGLKGDKQGDTEHHGGPERALCLYSLEVMKGLNAEGHPIAPGTTGENVLISGLEWSEVRPGCRYRLGDQVEIEIASYATPCYKIRASFLDDNFNRIHHKKHLTESRLYVRVLQGGIIAVGDAVHDLTETKN